MVLASGTNTVAKTLPHIASGGGTDFATFIALVLAVVAIGLSIHPPEKGHLTRFAATVCYVAAGELLGLKLTLPIAVRIGVGMGVILCVWVYKVFPFRLAVVRRKPKGPEAPVAPTGQPQLPLPQLDAGDEETLETTTTEGGWKVTRRGAARSQRDPPER
jgi:hypothetical protein